MALITFSSPMHKDKTVYAVAGSHTQTILSLAKEHHIPTDFGCQEGNCGTCLVKVSSVDGKRACAVQGCGRPARSKGYCAAHYQKFRMLDRTGRLPSDWVADAPPNSVTNIKLPRGRAGAKALAELKKK